ncbi:MAG: hypothetical protein PF450_06030 [Bacteroidales bacterium]|jgi:hypothetical protein|nr:hypothetical protein [Bacteroidales bacterium]
MKSQFLKLFILTFSVALLFSSCTAVSKTMREPHSRINLELSDFTLSEQVSADASSTKIIGVDWERFFKQETGVVQGGSSLLIDIASIPVMGSFVFDQTSNYALYEMMMQNPDYDVVMYPQFETTIERPILGIGFIMKKTSVTAKARLGKLKSE